MKLLKKKLCAAAVACLLAVPFSAAHAWGTGPFDASDDSNINKWGNDGMGDGYGETSMDAAGLTRAVPVMVEVMVPVRVMDLVMVPVAVPVKVKVPLMLLLMVLSIPIRIRIRTLIVMTPTPAVRHLLQHQLASKQV